MQKSIVNSFFCFEGVVLSIQADEDNAKVERERMERRMERLALESRLQSLETLVLSSPLRAL